MHGYLLNHSTQRAVLHLHRVLSKNRFTLFGTRRLFQRALSKNCFAIFGTRCLFPRLIGASLPKRNRKSIHMQTAYSRTNRSFTWA
ncbi:hypothetical protein CEV34_1870 [Brucella pseudogrignonensis]|uniref:Uncharacterized protein n=1 Tax=Brucella pseudogrignonensis TaxID=419475 RepID=A0A256GL53_9HYPH|nr:hypothetical protein CEV34_1870 [Brucella pseudogrignonensis]